MPGPLIRPIDAEEFASEMVTFAGVTATTPLAVAVSGGPDSMALIFCAKRWAKTNVIALIVDHALRDEAAAEAEQTSKILEPLGVKCEIMRWNHPPITKALHEKAREARYRLLHEACQRHKINHLMVAHHRDDQAETILMRLAKGTGIDGLGGMERKSFRDGLEILRPFLSFPKERLVATCRQASLGFVTDASNMREKFARGRLRKVMPMLAEEGMTVDSIVALGARATEAKQALDYYTHDFLQKAAKTEMGGSLSLDRTALREIPHAIALRAFAVCLRYVHDDAYPPEHASLSALLEVALGTEQETSRTLYGCIVSLAPNRIIILREPAAAIEALPLRGGETILWDKRWLVVSREKTDAAPLTVRALGIGTHELIDRLSPGLRHQIPQGRARASLPAMWRGGEIVGIPSFDLKASFSMSYLKKGLR